jgi:hypothetical protein
MALWALAIFVTYEVAEVPTLCIGTGFAIPQIYGCGASNTIETFSAVLLASPSASRSITAASVPQRKAARPASLPCRSVQFVWTVFAARITARRFKSSTRRRRPPSVRRAMGMFDGRTRKGSSRRRGFGIFGHHQLQ